MKPDAKKMRVLLAAGGALALLLLLACANYLAGAILFLTFGENPLQAEFWTIEQAWRNAPDARAMARIKGSIGFALLLSFGVPAGLAMLFRRESSDLFGKARFANRDDIRQEKLDAPKGVVIGKFENRLLRLGGYEFVLLAAPTRTGKGVGFCIPNLLQFEDSVVVLDIKGENYNLSSEFRRRYMGNEIIYFNPFSEDTHRWNPLSYINPDPNFRANDLMALASIIYPPNEKEPFWPDSARNLFVGLGLLVLETPELPRTIGEMLRQASGKGQAIEAYLGAVLAARAASAQPLSNSCRDAINRFLGSGETALKGIVATFTAALTPFANPVIDKATSGDDFDLRDVRRKKMAIYLNIPAGEVLQAGFIVNMFFSQLINENVKELPEQNPALKYQCLLLLDEFTAMGKVAIIAKGVGYMAGYNMRLALIIQDKTQLDAVYGKEDAHNIVSNMGAVIYFTPSQVSDAEEYSRMIGNDTVNSYSTQLAQGSLFGLKGEGGNSKTASYQSRAVMLPQELLAMSKDAQLVVRSGIPVIKAGKIRYFSDPYFKERFEAVPMQTVSIGGEKRKVPVPVARPKGDWAAYHASIANSDHYVQAAPAPSAQPPARLPPAAAAPAAVSAWPALAAPHAQPASVAQAYAEAALRYWRAASAGARGRAASTLTVLDLAPGSGQFCWMLLNHLMRLADQDAAGLPDLRYIACVSDAQEQAAMQSHPYFEPLLRQEMMQVALRQELLAGPPASLAATPLLVLAHGWMAGLPQLGPMPASDADLPPALQALAAMYRQRLPGAALALPEAAMACIDAVARLSAGRYLMLLSDIAVDDERGIRLGAFANGAPGANYHALAWHLRRSGAAVWQDAAVDDGPSLLCAVAGTAGGDAAMLRQIHFELGAARAGAREAAQAAQSAHAERSAGAANGAAALARLAERGDDPACLEQLLPELLKADWELPAPQLAAWRAALERAWRLYLPRGDSALFLLALAGVALKAAYPGLAREASGFAVSDPAHGASALLLLAEACETSARNGEAMAAWRQILARQASDMAAGARLRTLEQRVRQQDELSWYKRSDAESGRLWLEPLAGHHGAQLARCGSEGMREAPDMPALAGGVPAWIAAMTRPRRRISCAMMHERWGLVGVASLRLDEGLAQLEVWVAQEFRRRGFGGKGAAALLRMLKENAALDALCAFAAPEDKAGSALLERLGFRAAQEREGVAPGWRYRVPEGGEPRLLERLRLAGAATPPQAASQGRSDAVPV